MLVKWWKNLVSCRLFLLTGKGVWGDGPTGKRTCDAPFRPSPHPEWIRSKTFYSRKIHIIELSGSGGTRLFTLWVILVSKSNAIPYIFLHSRDVLCLKKMVGKGSAAMLPARRSAGVAQRWIRGITLTEMTSMGIQAGFEAQGRRSPNGWSNKRTSQSIWRKLSLLLLVLSRWNWSCLKLYLTSA